MNANEVGSEEDIREARDALLAEPAVRVSYDRQKSIILMARMLRRWRQKAELTQKELQAASGLRQSTISRIESSGNPSMPSLETIIAFAHGCGHPVTLGMSPERIGDRERASGREAVSDENGLAISL